MNLIVYEIKFTHGSVKLNFVLRLQILKQSNIHVSTLEFAINVHEIHTMTFVCTLLLFLIWVQVSTAVSLKPLKTTK